MAYIPLNKIITNLSTNGEEYQTSDGVIYAGPSGRNIQVKYFQGKIQMILPPSSYPQ